MKTNTPDRYGLFRRTSRHLTVLPVILCVVSLTGTSLLERFADESAAAKNAGAVIATGLQRGRTTHSNIVQPLW